MTPEQWLQGIGDAVRDEDWDAVSALRKQTNQSLAEAGDPDSLREFYLAALQSLDPSKSHPLISAYDEHFKAEVRGAISSVVDRVSAEPRIKGVYFEYYCDGTEDESNSGNFFLCETYSDTDDGWGAEFGEDGFIKGAQLPRYFFFDRDFEWDDVSRTVAEEAANGRLLAAVLEEWKLAGIAGMPLGFANHDHEMIRVVV
jgi:hypothetical protein